MMSILRHKGVDKLNVKLYRDNQIVEIMIIGEARAMDLVKHLGPTIKVVF